MKRDITIAAESRDTRGKNCARRLRVAGQAPAVIYGADKETIAVAVNPKEVTRILQSDTGHNTIFNVAISGGETTPVMIVDWQHDPTRGNLLHVDLKRIDMTKRIAVNVPVHVTGESKGVKQQGGLLEQITRDVEIECLPDEIPSEFVVNVTELMIGQNIRASEIALSGSVKLKSAAEAVIAHVITLREEAAPAAEEAEPAAVAEPEVIKKGKKEEEGEAEEKKKK